MKKVNPEYAGLLQQIANESPFLQLLSMKISKLSEGYCLVEMPISSKHYNPFDIPHGGVHAALLETAAYWAVYCGIDEGIGATVIDLKMDILGHTEKGNLVVEARQIKMGRTLCLVEATVKEESGKLLAFGIVKILLVQGMQTIDKVAEKRGSKLPPKFI